MDHENPAVNRCLRCNSSHIVEGTLQAPRGYPTPQFRPKGIDIRTAIKSLFWVNDPVPHDISVHEAALMCLSCGLLWSSASPEQAARTIERWCTDETKRKIEQS